jgi:hypothetical protein
MKRLRTVSVKTLCLYLKSVMSTLFLKGNHSMLKLLVNGEMIKSLMKRLWLAFKSLPRACSQVLFLTLLDGRILLRVLKSRKNKKMRSITNLMKSLIMFLKSSRTLTLVKKFTNRLWILAVGTGVLHVAEGNAFNPVNFSAIPLPHVVLDTGPDDRIDHVYRERQVR